MGNQWGGHLPLRPPNQNVGGRVPPITAAPVVTHAQTRSGRIDSNQILHIDSMGERSNIFGMTLKLVEGFRRSEGGKFGLSH